MPPTSVYRIDKIIEIALLGIRRASALMGMGVNLSNQDGKINYHLDKLSELRLLPEILSQEEDLDLRNSFRIWIEGNSLREAIESLSIFFRRHL